jgi:iron complex outermembrane recepter protein
MPDHTSAPSRTARRLGCAKTVAACAALELLLPGRAAAQVASVPAAVEPVEQVVVSANKREQRVQDVGTSITAFSGEQLKQMGVVSAIDLTKVTPGLNLAGSYGGQNVSFAIRGVVQQDFAATAETPNGVYIDEGYVGVNNVAGIGLFDLASAEVLKGPQGTLFGRNATGGVVGITTNNPTAQRTGIFDYTFGSYRTHRLEAALGGALSDSINGRIAAYAKSNAPYIDNLSPTGGDLGRSRDWGVRGKLATRIGESTDILLTAFATRNSGGWGPYFNETTAPVNDARGNQINSVIVAGPGPTGTIPSDPKNLKVNANDAQSSGTFTAMRGVQLKLRSAGVLDGTLTSITDAKNYQSQLNLDNDASAIHLLNSLVSSRFKQLSQELRWFKSSDTTQFTSGVFLLRMASDITPDKEVLGPAFGGVYAEDISHLTTTAAAAFGQLEWAVSPQLTLIGGLRYTHDEKHFNYRSTTYLLNGTLVGPTRGSFAGDLRDSLVTGKLQAEWRPQKQALLYAGYNRGAKAGSFNVPFFGGTSYPDSEIPYKPETIDAYEIGSKLDLNGGKLRLNAAAFYYDYKNFQAFKFIGLSTQVINRPSRTRGGELELIARPVSGLTLSTAASYTDNKVSGVSLGAITVDRVASYTSKWRGTGGIRYEFPALGGRLSAGIDAQHTGSFFYSLTNYDATRVPAYTLANARLGWADTNGAWTASLLVENLADKRYKSVAFDTAGVFGFAQVGYGKPRWISAQVSHRF